MLVVPVCRYSTVVLVLSLFRIGGLWSEATLGVVTRGRIIDKPTPGWLVTTIGGSFLMGVVFSYPVSSTGPFETV